MLISYSVKYFWFWWFKRVCSPPSLSGPWVSSLINWGLVQHWVTYAGPALVNFRGTDQNLSVGYQQFTTEWKVRKKNLSLYVSRISLFFHYDGKTASNKQMDSLLQKYIMNDNYSCVPKGISVSVAPSTFIPSLQLIITWGDCVMLLQIKAITPVVFY